MQTRADGLEIVVTSDGRPDAWPDLDAKATLPWKILTALAEDVRFERRDGVGRICFVKRVRALEVRA